MPRRVAKPAAAYVQRFQRTRIGGDERAQQGASLLAHRSVGTVDIIPNDVQAKIQDAQRRVRGERAQNCGGGVHIVPQLDALQTQVRQRAVSAQRIRNSRRRRSVYQRCTRALMNAQIRQRCAAQQPHQRLLTRGREAAHEE
jgi:hypothetical protein